MKTDFRTVAELAPHGTAFLCGNGYDHLVFQIDIVMLNPINFLVKSEEISLDVIFFAIVTYVQPL